MKYSNYSIVLLVLAAMCMELNAASIKPEDDSSSTNSMKTTKSRSCKIMCIKYPELAAKATCNCEHLDLLPILTRNKRSESNVQEFRSNLCKALCKIDPMRGGNICHCDKYPLWSEHGVGELYAGFQAPVRRQDNEWLDMFKREKRI